MIHSTLEAIKQKGHYLIHSFPLLFLTGCQLDTDNAIYNKVKGQTDIFTANTQQAKKDGVVYLVEIVYDFCNSLRTITPIVMVASWVIGIVLLMVIQQDQALRKRAIFMFIIGIPLIFFLLTYVLLWLVGAFQ